MDATNEFANRLARVRAGGLGCSRTIYVGIDEAYYVPARNAHQRPAVSTRLGDLLYPFSFVVAVMLGFAADALGRLFRFVMVPSLKLDPTTDMIFNAALGLIIGLFLTQAFRLRTNQYRVLQALGVFVSGCTFHNLVHWYPWFFGRMFSPFWVATITNTTKPDSILLRGISFVLH